MADALDISEVVRRTGLTSRALRFYEARGLVSPLRTASGRRYYGPAELERVNQILALKRAGLSLAQFALAWVLREPNVASAIVGASRPEQLAENAAASGAKVDPALFAEAERIVAAAG